ncbi:MAG: hypothetical protein GY715_20620 [Planctomycetes bacterium]|nr:hypothetical protein [Planctomycetota bacterium]
MRSRPTHPSMMICVIATGLLAACAPPPDRGFESAVPRDRMRAIARAVAEEDRSPETIRRLVEQLDSADPAVRMMAIAALERLTDEELVYEHHDEPAERRTRIRGVAAQLEPYTDDSDSDAGAADHG